VHSGADKRILWNLAEEFPGGLTGDDYYFVVHQMEESSGISPFVWAGAGAAVLGGVAYLLFGGSSPEQGGEPAGSFPLPPGRP
jgi:hypothetical protein